MFDWVKKMGRKSAKNHAILAYDMLGEPVWTSQNYSNLAKEGYQKNIIVYRCVNLIARSVASVKLGLYEGDRELDVHPLINLLRSPNPNQSKFQFFESIASYLLLSGNSYLNVISDMDGEPMEMYTLRPDRMTIVPGGDGFPEAFEYHVNDKVSRFVCSDDLSDSPILHLKLFNPLDDWYGMSPVQAASNSIDQHNAVSTHNLALLQNGGRPSGCLMIKNSWYELSEEQRNSLREKLRESYEGAVNTGRMMVLEGDFEWKEIGLSPKDMDFVSGKKLSAREISQAYGVPPILVGIEGDATFANYKEARFHFWEDTVIPMLGYIVTELNDWLAKRYGDGISIKYDEDSIPALAPKREMIWKRISEADFLTTNEKRQALGYSPLQGFDTVNDKVNL